MDMFSIKECFPEIWVEGSAWVFGLTETLVCNCFQCPIDVLVIDQAEGFAECASFIWNKAECLCN